jgi:hypothetical protein
VSFSKDIWQSQKNNQLLPSLIKDKVDINKKMKNDIAKPFGCNISLPF